MPNFAHLLLDAVNNYNDDDTESKNALRDLVCVISDNEALTADPLIKSLLYIASQKMRVFGYNIQNKLSVDPDSDANNLAVIKNEAIKQNYRSQVWANNILDKTQKDIIDFFQNLPTKRMLVSAPTSYGKTFIMREILFMNRERYNNVLLVFPTVALLRENANSMEELNQKKKLGYHVIKSVDSEVDIEARNIFVFTPERAMQLLTCYPDLKLDFFFYDEMYKIDEDFCYDETDEKNDVEEGGLPKKESTKPKNNFLDEARAKTFRICLYLLSKAVDEYYLAGPNLKSSSFGEGMKKYLNKSGIQIKEIRFEPTKRIRVDAYTSKIVVEPPLPFLPKKEGTIRTSKNSRICDVVNFISSNNYGQSLLYCTTPHKANGYAVELSKNQQGKQINDNEYKVFLEHIKRTYDIDKSVAEWSFVSVLQKGFAMHHGKLPKYIQKEVLEMFNKGIFDLLFCTSTIVEGVNTNAKNMIILNSSKGRTPLTWFDVKNIIGRAGRYYHNFIGRYFLLEKALVSIVESDELQLDFSTYSSGKLDAIDLDNAEFPDLSDNNQKAKYDRIEQHKTFRLPEAVFKQNRLIKKEYQEQLLNHLLTHADEFNGFHNYTKFPNILEQFTKYPALNTILSIVQKAGLLDEYVVKKYSAVSIEYCKNGFRGILKYEIDTARKNKTTIDTAYSNAFKSQKEIIEHKIPKLLTLFESVFKCAAGFKGYNIDNFSLSRVIRFYETGVRSYFGEQLVEYGFPIDTIRKIEENHKELLSVGHGELRAFINQNNNAIQNLLDEYEKQLFQKAIKSFD